MMKRFLFFCFCAIASTSWDAGAAVVPLPTTLDVLIAGNTATVGGLTFSQFAYSTSPVGSPPSAANITVSAFNVGPENGLTFSGGLFAPAGQTIDYVIQYVVTAAPGVTIADAVGIAVWNIPDGSTGFGTIGEILTPVGGGAAINLAHISSPDPGGIATAFVGANSYLVQKDILLVGGSRGIGVTIIDQGFSVVPAPPSFALLSIGLVGLVVGRRQLKRTLCP